MVFAVVEPVEPVAVGARHRRRLRERVDLRLRRVGGIGEVGVDRREVRGARLGEVRRRRDPVRDRPVVVAPVDVARAVGDVAVGVVEDVLGVAIERNGDAHHVPVDRPDLVDGLRGLRGRRDRLGREGEAHAHELGAEGRVAVTGWSRPGGPAAGLKGARDGSARAGRSQYLARSACTSSTTFAICAAARC